MLNPFKMGDVPDFGLSFFLMMVLMQIFQTGVWQGGAGYMTSARTPHEARMGNILGNWRWLLVGLGTACMAIAAYVVVWSPQFLEVRAEVAASIGAIGDPSLQSQMLVPLALREFFAPGIIGLFAILMLGASISTDDSAYHSWGSIFLQDVIMPFRKKPFTKEEHLRYLKWSIVMIGVIALVFSSIWTMKDFILMWFQITGSIYVGGASCAIIGGLYWKRATAAGAWSGLITGSMLSVGGIIFKQIYPDVTFPWNEQVINGLHLAVFAVLASYAVFIVVSIFTCREPYNMDRLLHRGPYAVLRDVAEPTHPPKQTPLWLRKLGINHEFSKFDIFVYLMMSLWTFALCVLFLVGTAYNLTHDVPSEAWHRSWQWILVIQVAVAIASSVWFTCGGVRDTLRLFRDLKNAVSDETDDGMVKKASDS
jgi:SSS family solute:Na+ symporter